MRKLFVVALATSLFMALGASSAFAAGNGGGDGKGNACPPNSKNPNGTPPNCGNGNGGNGGNNGGNNGCKDKNKNDNKNCPPNNGCKNKPNCPPDDDCEQKKNCPPDDDCDKKPDDCEPPEGNCTQADLVIFDPAKILCLYFGEKAPLADKEEDWPDALISVPIDELIGACVFLPPATDDNGGNGGGGLPGLPSIPGLPTS